jgi:hypothetical protein
LERYTDKLRRAFYLSGADHVLKISDRKQRTEIVKYSLVNRTFKNWNQLPAEVLGTFPCKPKIFRNGQESNYKRVEMKGIELRRNHLKVQ